MLTFYFLLHTNNIIFWSLASNSASSSGFILGPEMVENPGLWRPKLCLQQVTKDKPSTSRRQLSQQQQSAFHQPAELVTCNIDHRWNDPRLILEDKYDVQGSYSRGLFVLLAKRNIPHTFVFHYPNHPWFQDLYGLRKVNKKKKT
jgi:hypothetical protein